MSFVSWFCRILFILGLGLLALAFTLGRVSAHSWYDGACCSDKDCSEFKGTVTEGKTEYRLSDGRAVPLTDPRVRQSKDYEFHVCERADKTIICLYVPGRGT